VGITARQELIDDRATGRPLLAAIFLYLALAHGDGALLRPLRL
jgi:hypothetical protein